MTRTTPAIRVVFLFCFAGLAVGQLHHDADCMHLVELGLQIECPEMFIQEHAALKTTATTTTPPTTRTTTAKTTSTSPSTHTTTAATTTMPPSTHSTPAPPGTQTADCEDTIHDIVGQGKDCNDVQGVCSSSLFAPYCRKYCNLCGS